MARRDSNQRATQEPVQPALHDLDLTRLLRRDQGQHGAFVETNKRTVEPVQALGSASAD